MNSSPEGWIFICPSLTFILMSVPDVNSSLSTVPSPKVSVRVDLPSLCSSLKLTASVLISTDDCSGLSTRIWMSLWLVPVTLCLMEVWLETLRSTV